MSPSAVRPEDLLDHLQSEPQEQPSLKFKVGDADPEMIARTAAALANGAALANRPAAYLVWGVRDDDHAFVGATVDISLKKRGNEDLIAWLPRVLNLHVELLRAEHDGATAWILEIAAATDRSVSYPGVEYIRIGSYTKKLADFPEYERRLWDAFRRGSFEAHTALDGLEVPDLLRLLDYPSYFSLTQAPLPENRDGIIEHLATAGLVHRDLVGWSITNLGAIAFAGDLDPFPSLRRKRVRIIHYNGTSRMKTLREVEVSGGYARSFEEIFRSVDNLLPRNEQISEALRTEHPLYPPLALRELLGNMLIHQDFAVTGAGPMVEIFDNRMEITNPGTPLIAPDRFVDLPPRSRNEQLASLMRRAHICEERGSGWDKIVGQVEVFQLPPPSVEILADGTRIVLPAPRPLTRMDRDDRTRTVYQHACLRYVTGEAATNATVRARFGIPSSNSPQASRLLNEALGAGRIALPDNDAGYRNRQYVPYWAVA